MTHPRILVSNDDGIHSPGLEALAQGLEQIGEVTVVAPDRERSAASHAISLHRPLRLRRVDTRRFACDGTPTDAVYLGIHHVLADRRPDLLVSGINLGANIADDVTYSGTLAAAFEGTLFEVPSIAMSQAGEAPWDFSAAADFAKALGTEVLERGLAPGILLNVNVPGNARKGAYRVTRQGRRTYGDSVEVRRDPRGRQYYWIGGSDRFHDDIPESDCNAVLEEGLISVTPLHLDLTAYASLEAIRSWSVRGFEPI